MALKGPATGLYIAASRGSQTEYCVVINTLAGSQVQHRLEMVLKCGDVWKLIDVNGDGRIFDSLGMQVRWQP